MTSPSEEPAWKQRAVERSIKTAKLRAAQLQVEKIVLGPGGAVGVEPAEFA